MTEKEAVKVIDGRYITLEKLKLQREMRERERRHPYVQFGTCGQRPRLNSSDSFRPEKVQV